MQGAGNNEAQKLRIRTRAFVIAGYTLLCLMALCSSLDHAFVYIFSGAAVFLFFLAWQNWSVLAKLNHANPSFKKKQTSLPPILAELMRLFRRTQPGAYTTRPSMQQQQRITLIVVAFIISIFTGLFIVIFTSSTDRAEAGSEWKVRGDEYYTASQFDSAYLMYKRSIMENENVAEGYYGLATVKGEVKDYDSAIYFYTQALGINPVYSEALYGRSWIYYTLKDYQHSLQDLKTLIGQNEGYNDAYLLAGDNYYVQEKYDSAILYYEPAYERGVRSSELLNIMAYIYDTQGRTDEAISFYEQTLQYDSTLIEVHKRLGELIPGEEGNQYRMKAGGQQW